MLRASRILALAAALLFAAQTPAPIAEAQPSSTLGALLQRCGTPAPGQPSMESYTAAVTYTAAELTEVDGWTCSDQFYHSAHEQVIAVILGWLRQHTEKYGEDEDQAIIDAFVANYNCHSPR